MCSPIWVPALLYDVRYRSIKWRRFSAVFSVTGGVETSEAEGGSTVGAAVHHAEMTANHDVGKCADVEVTSEEKLQKMWTKKTQNDC